jgi:hypothetical protein
MCLNITGEPVKFGAYETLIKNAFSSTQSAAK